jgi:hypothetical protein
MTRVIAHELDCPALCGCLNRDGDVLCGRTHACTCRGEAWLREAIGALEAISKHGFGIDGSETDTEAAKYWSALALRYRSLARAALQPFREEKK